jgi:beta propeller repeat protein
MNTIQSHSRIQSALDMLLPRTLKTLAPRWLIAGLMLLPLANLQGQQQFQGVCSRVKMVIEQELTLERIGFEATLEVTDNDGADPITDFFAELTFENPVGGTNGAPVDASSLFFVRAPTFQNINSIDGNGVIAPTTKAVIRWFIIPKIAAGGTSPAGLRYRVGCKLAGKIRGTTIPGDVLFAVPDTITVRPEPQLEINYFQPRDVQGDDPFTPEVESPIPFTLGVLVKNVGHGPARKLKIDSKQPRIVENINGLLLVAQLLGARVADVPQRTPSLLVDLGDIQPGQTRKGSWDMITSLSGEFVDFRASYRHATELGGEETSVIIALNAHFIAKEVLNDEPGRDQLKDFLADVDRDVDMYPDSLYESQGEVLPVNLLSDATVIGSAGAGGSFEVRVSADKDGWGYVRVVDPGQAKLKIGSVVRSDGKVVNTNNVWTNIRYTKLGNTRQNWLNIFDRVDLGNYTYRITYAAGGPDTIAPVTTLHFAGPATESGSTVFITPATQMYFISEDVNPVSIVYSLTNSPFIPALPFTLSQPGNYKIVYYATDNAGNREVAKTNLLVVSGEASLDFAKVTSPADPIFVPGDALSIRPSEAPIQFQIQPNPAETAAKLDIFQGVIGWVTVSNTPSSPTRNTSATLTIGGDQVQWYRYRLDSAAWSAEIPVTSPLVLSNLSNGPHTVAVLGRSSQGSYLPETSAVVVGWTINPTAPPVLISGVPPTPSRLRNATLTIGGSGVTDYRWTLNGSFFRAETPVANPLILPTLDPTQQVVSVVGKSGGIFQLISNATTATWLTDPTYGSDFSSLPKVYTRVFTNVATNLVSFNWDGKDQGGAILPPGYYTARITLSDALGRTNFTTRLIQIGNLTSDPQTLADVIRGPRNPHARGRWAVWQDQSDGYSQVYAQNLAETGTQPLKLTSGILSQESPKTDGRHVVWQGRQTNATWDIYIKDLQSAAPPRKIADTANRDEVNPCIEWPWVVFQSRVAGNASAPWQLRAYHAVSGDTVIVSSSTQDQLDPDIQEGRVVWQDFRNVGFGEIYFKNLETGEARRITTNPFGQYSPAIYDRWIVWADNRNDQVDIYGYDLFRDTEVRITQTPEDEFRPYLDGTWLACLEDSLGVTQPNVRLIHLPTLRAVPITRTRSQKDRVAISGGRAVWQEAVTNLARIQVAELPALQAVFQNANAVAITPAMVSSQRNAHTLLTLWHQQAGIQSISRYSSLVPKPVKETATWSGTGPSGANFDLVAGSFLWIEFESGRVLDLGAAGAASLNLASGVNAFSFSRFPSQYSAYQLLGQLGVANARGVRMLDSESGRWLVASYESGRLVGNDFLIPKVAVLLLDMANPVNNFRP